MDELNFGQYLRTKRKEKGMTLKDLGLLVDLSHSYLSQVETGDRGVPNIDDLRKIISVLELDDIECLSNAGASEEIKRIQYIELDNIISFEANTDLFSNTEFLTSYARKTDFLRMKTQSFDECFGDVTGLTVSDYVDFLESCSLSESESGYKFELKKFKALILEDLWYIEDIADRIAFISGFKFVIYDFTERKKEAEELISVFSFLVKKYSLESVEFYNAISKCLDELSYYFEDYNYSIGTTIAEDSSIDEVKNHLIRVTIALEEKDEREDFTENLINTIEDFINEKFGKDDTLLNLDILNDYKKVCYNGKVLSKSELGKVTALLEILLSEEDI